MAEAQALKSDADKLQGGLLLQGILDYWGETEREGAGMGEEAAGRSVREGERKRETRARDCNIVFH